MECFVKRKRAIDGRSNQCKLCTKLIEEIRIKKYSTQIKTINLNSIKTCKKCQKKKQLFEFNKDRRMKDGRASKCKECQRNYDNEYYKKNNTNRRKVKNAYVKNKRKNDTNYRIRRRISALFAISIKNNKGQSKTQEFFKYTGIKIKDYIKRLKKDKLWNVFESNNLKIHIDHIIPLSKYNFKNKNEIKKAWNPRNLRLSFAKDNLSKSNKIIMNLVRKYKIKDLLPSKISMEKLNGQIEP